MKQERRSLRKQSWQAERFSRVTLLFAVMHVLSSLWIIPMASANKYGIEVARMIDNERLEECNLNLGRADADGDDKLDSHELVPLVSSLSQGRISVEEFRDLPLRLRMIYHWTACSCVFEPDAAVNCCIGDAAHVNIDDAETDLPFMVNRLFCSELTRGIDKVQDEFPAVTPVPSRAPSVSPSTSPTTSSPSSSPSTTSPSASPSIIPTLVESASPTEEPPPSAVPSTIPTETITTSPTVAPSTTPTHVPPETLCVTFQYELVNNRSLTADDVLNENDNTIKTGLLEATEALVIRILNETFPRTTRAARPMAKPVQHSTRRHDPNDWQWRKPSTAAATSHDPDEWNWLGGGRRLSVWREAVVRADAAILGVDVEMYSFTIQNKRNGRLNETTRNRRLQVSSDSSFYMRGSRRLVYYTDEFPIEIPIIIDNPICPANSDANGVNTIRCAIVSSNLCVVLETGDDPQMIRRALIDGLSDAIDSGEFEDLIAQERLGGRRL